MQKKYLRHKQRTKHVLRKAKQMFFFYFQIIRTAAENEVAFNTKIDFFYSNNSFFANMK